MITLINSNVILDLPMRPHFSQERHSFHTSEKAALEAYRSLTSTSAHMPPSPGCVFLFFCQQGDCAS